MNIFLIDYENVSFYGFEGVDKLKKKDKIYLFYSAKTENIRTDIISTIVNNKISLRTFKLHKTDKNALDFQLVLFLGMCIKKYKEKGKLYIVSKDNGYQSAIDFAKDYLNVNIQKVENIEEAFTGIKPKLLLECNSLKDNTSNVSIVEKIDIPQKVKKLDLITNSKNAKSKRRTLILQALKTNKIIAMNFNDNQLNSLSAVLCNSQKNTTETAPTNILNSIGKKKEHLIPIILECCKDFIREI